MKIRTETQLCDAIDQDFIWRKKELTHLKFLLDSAKGRGDREATVLRGGVTLLYAHWEGFVKFAALAYLEYVASQRLRFDELAPAFLALAARPILSAATGAKRIRAHLDVAKFFRAGLSEKSTIPYKDGVTTKANLSSDVLAEITDTLGLDFTPFRTKANLIDETLLRTRNTVAHGEYLLLTIERYEQLAQEVLAMMENFRTQVQNAAALRQFKAA